MTLTLLLLMFVGASSGSTTASIKVVRHLMLFRLARRELEQAVHPDIVVPVRVSGGDRGARAALRGDVRGALPVRVRAGCAESGARRPARRRSARRVRGAGRVGSCLGNVGAAFGSAGPFGSYAGFSDLSKVMPSILILLGRVEIVPIAVLFTRSYWGR